MRAIDELIIDFDIDKPHAMRTRHGMAKNARAELTALHAELQAARATIALNKYVVPPFELTDDATVQLALELARKDERIAELETMLSAAQSEYEQVVIEWDDAVDRKAALETAVNEARSVMNVTLAGGGAKQLRMWLTAHPAPQAEQGHAHWYFAGKCTICGVVK